MKNAKLIRARVQGANLAKADLTGANLKTETKDHQNSLLVGEITAVGLTFATSFDDP